MPPSTRSWPVAMAISAVHCGRYCWSTSTWKRSWRSSTPLPRLAGSSNGGTTFCIETASHGRNPTSLLVGSVLVGLHLRTGCDGRTRELRIVARFVGAIREPDVAAGHDRVGGDDLASVGGVASHHPEHSIAERNCRERHEHGARQYQAL